MTKRAQLGLLILFTLLAPLAASAQTTPGPVVRQYTADWDQVPGFQPSGPVWDPGAAFEVVFQSLTPDLINSITSSNDTESLVFYKRHFQHVLQKWAFEELTADVHGAALVADTIALFSRVYDEVRPYLARKFPGYPDDVYKALTVQNLAHGYHIYSTSLYYEAITDQIPYRYTTPILMTGQLTLADEFESLLQTPVADCGELAELVRVMGRIWGLDIRYLGIWVDYLSPRANAEVQSTHALGILVYTADPSGTKAGLLVDALTNMAIATGPVSALLPAEMKGDGIIAASSTAAGRYAALSNSGKILRFFNYFMHPPIREGYLKASLPDPSLVSFMYVYFLEAYPNALRSYAGATGWQINTADYSLKQPLD